MTFITKKGIFSSIIHFFLSLIGDLQHVVCFALAIRASGGSRAYPLPHTTPAIRTNIGEDSVGDENNDAVTNMDERLMLWMSGKQ